MLKLRMYSKDKFPLRIYDTIGLELSADRQEHAVNQILESGAIKEELSNILKDKLKNKFK